MLWVPTVRVYSGSKPMVVSSRVQVILNPVQAETLQILARIQKRSISNLASKIIEEYLASDTVAEDLELARIRDQLANDRIRDTLEGAGLSRDKLLKITQILTEDPGANPGSY